MMKSFDEINKSIATLFPRSTDENRELTDKIIEVISKYAFEVETLKRRLYALEAALKAKDVIIARYGQQSKLKLARLARLNAREALSADGLYELEYDATGAAFRWTGPTNFTRFLVWVDRSIDIIARIDILEGGDSRNLNHCSLQVDGVPYPLQPDVFSNTLLSQPILATDVQGPTEIVLHVPYTFCPADNGENDDRILGIRFHQLELTPLEG